MHFDTEEELQKHSRSHKGDRSYKCTYDKCSYTAKTLDKLNAHERYHSGERPFKCDFIGCHQEFIQSHHLARHRKTHFGSGGEQPTTANDDDSADIEDQIQCGLCDLTFEDESELSLHMNSEHQVIDNCQGQSTETNKRKAEDIDTPDQVEETPPIKV